MKIMNSTQDVVKILALGYIEIDNKSMDLSLVFLDSPSDSK